MLALALSFFLLPQDPLDAQLPKKDLGVDAFLLRHPDYDGRGVRVAVVDTGVDPGHPFLQRTPGGRRKLVDWYDATSDGRVLLTAPRPAEADGSLIGLSGRRLQLGRWAVAQRDYRLGRVDAPFFPADLRERVQEQRRRQWEEGRRKHQEEKARLSAQRLPAAAEEAPQPDLAARETERHWDSFQDLGPVHDLVVFQDGDAWRVVLDADEDGDLGEETALRPFRDSGDWATLGDAALLNYAVDVASDASCASLFFDSTGHGTHVAGIVGAWQGDGGRLNGVAPGVELVAIKIGDGKYGGSTSGFAIAKALDYALAAGCQVANLSFGGPSFFADGREPDAWVIDEAVRRGLIVVTSAGNEGPALSTVGSPGTAAGAIAVAAAIWPATQSSNYAALAPAPPLLFDFSSRGPLPTGDLGVDFTAPGAAVSALPSWLITPAENFNGTSMAAPQMSGCVALLLCAAAAERLPAAPPRLHRALRLAATPLPQHAWVEQGHGVIDLPAALAALRGLAGETAAEQGFTVEVANPYGVGAGIYERDLPSIETFERRVQVKPQFAADAGNALKASFQRTWRVRGDADWLETPALVYCSAQGASFQVRVKPELLGVGLHSARVLLHDADRPPGAGPDLIVPVTIVVPLETWSTSDHLFRRTLILDPGQLERTFLRVPLGAGAARVRLTHRGPGRNDYRTGAGSVSGTLYHEQRQKRGRFLLGDGGSAEQEVPVEPGTVFEYTVASRWVANERAAVELEVEFLGLTPHASEWVIPAGQGTGYLAVKSLLRAESAAAAARIDGVAVPVVAPLQIVPDPIRATVFGDRGMFYGVVEQSFCVEKDGTPVVLRMPHSIQSTELREDLMVELFDANRGVVARKIAYELDTELGSLAAGGYLLRLCYPALGKDVLEARYAGAELRLGGLDKSLDLYGDLDKAMTGRGASGQIEVPYMGARTLFARVPELEPLAAGSYYYGSAALRRGERLLLQLPLRVERPGGGGKTEELLAGFAARGAEEEHAWREAEAAQPPDPAVVLEKARAWEKAAPRLPAACLARLRALAAAGLADQARAQAGGFLQRFPEQVEEFLDAAAAWNP